LKGDECSASSPSHFTQRARTDIPIAEEAGWAPELVYMFWRRHISLAPCQKSNPKSSTMQSCYYTDYAIPPS